MNNSFFTTEARRKRSYTEKNCRISLLFFTTEAQRTRSYTEKNCRISLLFFTTEAQRKLELYGYEWSKKLKISKTL